MKIVKLYSEDNLLFDPISFKSGFNLIIGDRSEGSEKRNGVGKTISVEFLNFMLLGDIDKSRLSKIPSALYEKKSTVFLDIEISGKEITITRDMVEPKEVTITESGISQILDISNARKILLSKIEFKTNNSYCSFRELVNPIVRDERCEFKSIPKYSDTNVTVPINFMPHLFYLGLDNSSLKAAMRLKESINADTSVKAKIKQQLETLSGKDIGDVRVELNKLTEEKNVLNSLIKNKDYSVFDKLDDHFQVLNVELKDLRRQISAKRLKLRQIDSLKKGQQIDVQTVELIYNKIRKSLATEVSKSLTEVIEFKNTIDSYTNNIISNKSDLIDREIKGLEERRSQLLNEREQFERSGAGDDVEYDMKEAVGQLAILEKSIAEIELHLKRIDKLEKEIKRQKIELDQEKLDIELLVEEDERIISSFQTRILSIHKGLFDDHSASFDINVNNRKEVISFDMRIKEDGGHSNERGKVFIYDFALLLHDFKYSNHLGFLLHDNIFDNDDDTLQKALNYIEEALKDREDKQYILTLNSDKLVNLKLDFDPLKYRRAKFTKASKFLKETYTET
jgi:uncharacterized protein YydD (DUF2326 family)